MPLPLLGGQGFLTQLLGAAQPDPLGAVLGGEYYDPNDARAAKVSRMLHGIGNAFLNPPKGGGDMAVLASAVGAAGPEYVQGGDDYMRRALFKRGEEEAAREANMQKRADLALADFVAQHPELQGMGPEKLRQFIYEQNLDKYGIGTSGQTGVEHPGLFYDPERKEYYRSVYDASTGEERKDYQGKSVPSWDPGVKGAQAEATTRGKTEAEKYFEDVDFANTVGADIASMDTAIAGADRFAGISIDKVLEAGGNPQEYYDWVQNMNAVRATATAATLDEAKLYPMSEADRRFVATMATGGMDQWNSPANVKRLIKVLRDSSIKRINRIKEGKSTQMPDLDALLKQVSPKGNIPPITKSAIDAGITQDEWNNGDPETWGAFP